MVWVGVSQCLKVGWSNHQGTEKGASGLQQPLLNAPSATLIGVLNNIVTMDEWASQAQRKGESMRPGPIPGSRLL